jgi:hypothetical protein
MESVIKATLIAAASGTVEMGIREDIYFEHSSRQCTPRGAMKSPACICAGTSQKLSWLAQYTYTLKVTGLGSIVAVALAEGRAFARVKHTVHNWTRGSPGYEKEVEGWTVVEYFRIKGSGESDSDCITYSHPFNADFACWLRSEVETEIVLQLSDGSKIEDVTMESKETIHPKSGEERPPNTPKDLTKKKNRRGISVTPSGITWRSPEAGGNHSATTVLEPNPHHCANWKRYINDQSGDFRHRNTTPGKYFTPSGDPPGIHAGLPSEDDRLRSAPGRVPGESALGANGGGLPAVGAVERPSFYRDGATNAVEATGPNGDDDEGGIGA